MCLSCDRKTRVGGSRLKELDKDGATFKSITTHFDTEWRSAVRSKTIDKVYEITIPRDVRARHSAFRKRASPMYEVRTYQSSQCVCDLGTQDASLCAQQSCGICSVIKSSFKEFAFGVPHNDGRYGAGVYSYQNPALADRFATSCTSSPYRVMIACEVVVGPGRSLESLQKSNEDDGEPIFVSNVDAIVPSYVIMYQ